MIPSTSSTSSGGAGSLKQYTFVRVTSCYKVDVQPENPICLAGHGEMLPAPGKPTISRSPALAGS
ncbi:MAG: hypothetical protein GX216_09415 [Methanomicrobiales archaeon]|nr:hypothetical protein [Methanomicrobiales archaeon]